MIPTKRASATGLPPIAPALALQPRELLGLFERSAPHYDRIDRAMTLGFGGRYRREALERAGVERGVALLDVGCGTGLLAQAALAVVGERGSVTAIDPSRAMIERARHRGISTLRLAVAERLPFADRSFDTITMGYALRHVSDVDRAFAEFHRVLRPGGQVLLLEQTPPGSRLGRAIFRAYMAHVVPALTRAVTRSADAQTLMTYYWRTIERCVTPAAILDSLHRAGFAEVGRHVEMGAFSEYVARRPRAS